MQVTTMAEAKAKNHFCASCGWRKPDSPAQRGYGAVAEAMESGHWCRSSIDPTTGKRYKGINAIHLMAQGYNDQRWMTYKQATAAGAQVRKGEKVRVSILEIH